MFVFLCLECYTNCCKKLIQHEKEKSINFSFFFVLSRYIKFEFKVLYCSKNIHILFPKWYFHKLKAYNASMDTLCLYYIYTLKGLDVKMSDLRYLILVQVMLWPRTSYRFTSLIESRSCWNIAYKLHLLWYSFVKQRLHNTETYLAISQCIVIDSCWKRIMKRIKSYLKFFKNI